MLTEIFTPPLSFPFKTQLHTPSIELYQKYFQIFLPDFQNQFPKKEKSDLLSEHRLSAIPLPLLSVNWKKISSQSWPKNRVAEILYSFSLSVEGE